MTDDAVERDERSGTSVELEAVFRPSQEIPVERNKKDKLKGNGFIGHMGGEYGEK